MELLKKTAAEIKNIDRSLADQAQKKLDNLTKPQGSLGRLEEMAKRIVEISGSISPTLKHKAIFTMAGDHGVVEEGVSAYPKEVTLQMVHNFLSGGAGINVLAKHVGARVVVVDVGVACDMPPKQGLVIKKVGYGTKNMAKGPAMTMEEAVRSVEAGIESVMSERERGLDIAGTGDMGIGNTTPSSAITAIITGKPVKEVTGRGTGINDLSFLHKIEVIEKSIAVNKPDPKNGLDVLSKVGGFEIGALAGVILACAAKKIPVVIDGFISGAAALIAYKIEPKVKDYMIAAHCSVEQGHSAALEFLGLKPILDLGMRLGEGTGAALAINIVDAGVKILNEMATFESAGVSKED